MISFYKNWAHSDTDQVFKTLTGTKAAYVFLTVILYAFFMNLHNPTWYLFLLKTYKAEINLLSSYWRKLFSRKFDIESDLLSIPIPSW